MILDAETVKKREEARIYFPDAEFLPGDEPPVGAGLHVEGLTEIVECLGEYRGPEPHFRFWWIVRGKFGEMLQWPPTLKRAQTK